MFVDSGREWASNETSLNHLKVNKMCNFLTNTNVELFQSNEFTLKFERYFKHMIEFYKDSIEHE